MARSLLDNRLLGLGMQVVFGSLVPQRAVELARSDDDLKALTDEALGEQIAETDRYWRAKLDSAVRHPENTVVYPMLMAATAEARLRAIGQFRAGLPEDQKEPYTQRMAAWLTVTAECLLAEAMAHLLLPDLQGAWQIFTKANALARALPDSGQLRLRETLWACYGQRTAAAWGGQQQLRLATEAEMSGLMQMSGREQEAQTYLAEIRQRFDALEKVLEQRKEAPQEPEEDRSQSADPVTYVLHYVERLNHSAGQFLARHATPLQARGLLFASIEPSRLDEKYVYFLSLSHRRLAEEASDRAAILAGLNYAVAARSHGPNAGLTRGECAFAVGNALARLAGMSGDQKTYRRATRFLGKALTVLDGAGTDTGPVECALIASQLALCHRGSRDFAGALAWGEEAVRRCKALPPKRRHRADLGVAYGNLADVQEQLGDAKAALANHFRAFELFEEAQDLQHLRQALYYYARLCQRLGRLDDAMAATARGADFMAKLADTRGAVRCYLQLARHAFSLRSFAAALGYLQRAEDLLKPRVERDQVEREDVELFADLSVLEGYVFTLMLGAPGPGFSVERAARPLERARAIAARLQDHERSAAAILQLCKLYIHSGQLDAAEAYCDSLALIPASGIYAAATEDVAATLLLRRGGFDAAALAFENLLPRYADAAYAEQLYVVYVHLGEAYAGARKTADAARAYESAIDTFERRRLSLFESSRLDVAGSVAEIYDRLIVSYSAPDSAAYDPRRAFSWLEKSKSRTLVEAIGYTRLPVGQVGGEVQPAFEAEDRLIGELNQLRAVLFTGQATPQALLETRRNAAKKVEQLQALWTGLAASFPEYVELRRGATVEWDDVRGLLEA